MNIRKLAHGLYAGTAYVVGMGALLYLMAFVIGAPVPKTIDAGPTVPLPESPLMNLALLAAFLVPHSVMARPRFKACSRPSRPVPFTARWLYGLVRHPISLGWLLVFWSSPVMSAGHLVFALGMSLYIAMVTPLEERDLVTEHGDEYRRYQAHVPAFVPIPRRDDEHTEPSRRFS